MDSKVRYILKLFLSWTNQKRCYMICPHPGELLSSISSKSCGKNGVVEFFGVDIIGSDYVTPSDFEKNFLTACHQRLCIHYV